MLGATNDNILRWLVIGIGKQFVEPRHYGAVLTSGTICFVVPYLLLAAPAGFLADRYSKRKVIVACKVVEIFIMLAAVVAIWWGSLEALFVVVALMGSQSALFGPSKLGSIPEMLPESRISAANGLVGLTTVVATVVGMAIGNLLSDATQNYGNRYLWLVATVLIGVAIAGWMTSLLIVKLTPANPHRRFPWNALPQTWRDLRMLASNGPLFRVALGIMFFWAIGALAQLNIDQFATESGTTSQQQVIPLLIALVCGVGVGSVLAGVWSAGRVELGILPLGAVGVAVSSFLLFTVQGSIVNVDASWTAGYVWACIFLFMLGTSAGLFDVPLAAYMQHRSPPANRGTILAASNFMTFVGILVSALLFALMRAPLRDGTISAIPAVGGVTLSPAATGDLEQTRARFNAARQQDPTQSASQFLENTQVSEPERTLLLAQLLWDEMEGRRSAGQFLDRNGFVDQFSQTGDQQLALAVYEQVTGPPWLSSRQIFLISGLCTVPVFIYIICLIPQASMRFMVWMASWLIYRIRVEGQENIPAEGGALLVANHVSYLDAVLLLIVSARPIRIVAWAGNFKNLPMQWLARLWGAFLLPNRPKALARTLKAARQALTDGALVGIFPEGAITRSGALQSFKAGALKIHKGSGVPIIPVYLDELWGSIFSYRGGKFFWKWPRRWPYPVSILIGQPIAAGADMHEVRQTVEQLGAKAVELRSERMQVLPISLVRLCKRRKFSAKVADSSGAALTGGALLMRALILRRLLDRLVFSQDESYVGVLLPPTTAGVVVNASLALSRRVAVNLNYTVSSEVMNECIRQSQIRHVLTSRRFMEKMEFDLDCEVVYLEDFKDQAGLSDKLVGGLASYVFPARMVERSLGLHEIKPDDVLTVIFTSGSTGTPKGVMLTHKNVGSNIDAIEKVVSLTSRDVIVGILPFFHSFGYTVTLWGTLGINVKGVFHFSPLDARQVGKLCRQHHGTVFLSTPTFLRSYLRRCDAADFASLDVVVAGAEKLPRELCDSFEEKFGVRPVEGYGATELSPLVAVNVPSSRQNADHQVDAKEGTVGRPIPGVTARIVDLDSGDVLGAEQPGMLQIRGSNVMLGYLNRDDLTAEVVRDGWYVTGDVALIDDDGFIKITGRQSRFSKIGGEMVPHIMIEETLTQIIGEDEEQGLQAAVTAVPDAKKGERLIVIHTSLQQTPEQLCQALSDAGLPNIYIPSQDSFLEVEELPFLGSGKLDLKRIQQIALEHFV